MVSSGFFATLYICSYHKFIIIHPITKEKFQIRSAISGPPKILRDNLQMILHTKVGRTVAWDVEVIGDPITDKVWTDGKGGIVEDTDRITILNADYSSKVTFAKAQRKDTQRYKVHFSRLRDMVISDFTQPI